MSQTTGKEASPPDEIAALLDAVRTQIAADPALSAMAAGCLDRALTYIGHEARTLPSLPVLWTLRDKASAGTQSLTEAVMAAAPHLYWQQSYSVEQVGQDFLDRYGWFNLISPDGPYLSETHRISMGYWDHGLYYPRHWHAPEEIYLVVAGRARFVTDGMEDADLGPGGTRFHPSNIPHAAAMHDGPLLALAIWRGEALMSVSSLAPEGLR